MGKTRLARQVMAEAAPLFGDGAGIRFCGLAACANEAEFQAAVAQALDLPHMQGTQLALAIADRGPLLLVLDNLESILDQAIPTVASWLENGVELQILTTSLLPTGLDGELVFSLEPLALEDAVELYLQRAKRAWSHRTFSERERPVIEGLVERLDRIPLAIELAAARVRILPPRQMLARISERFELLQPSRPGRQKSLLEALTLTWRLLEPTERRILAQASVFEGGFDLHTAEAVLGEEGGSAEVRDLIDGLVQKALIQFDDGDPPRFTLFDSVREFAALQLERSEDPGGSVRRHAAYFLEEGEKQIARFDGMEARAAMRWLGTERANLIAAHRRMIPIDPAVAARVGLVLTAGLSRVGPPVLELELMGSTVAAAEQAGDHMLLLRALLLRVSTLQRLGRSELALEDVSRGIVVAREAGSKLYEGLLYAEAGSARTMMSDLDGAFASLAEARRIAGEIDDPLLSGYALSVLGAAEEARSLLGSAGAHYEEAIAIFRKHGGLKHRALTLVGIGAVRSGQARFREAREATEEARDLFRILGHRAAEANALGNLGSVELTAGQLDEAEAYCLEALAMQRELGNRRFEALSVGNLGLISLERGETRLAEQRLREALAILRETGDKRYHGMCLSFLAVAEATLGRVEEGRKGLEAARAAFRELGDVGSLEMTRILEGLLELAESRELLLAGQAEAAAAFEARARSRVDLTVGDLTESLFLARRLLERSLARKGGEPPPIREDVPASGILLGPEAEWFEFEGARVDLRRRGAIRRMLLGLVEQRLLAPGIGLGPQAIFEIGWPGETIAPESAATRVYTAIRTLRSLGLTSVLLRHEDGYLLEPQLGVSRSSSRS